MLSTAMNFNVANPKLSPIAGLAQMVLTQCTSNMGADVRLKAGDHLLRGGGVCIAGPKEGHPRRRE